MFSGETYITFCSIYMHWRSSKVTISVPSVVFYDPYNTDLVVYVLPKIPKSLPSWTNLEGIHSVDRNILNRVSMIQCSTSSIEFLLTILPYYILTTSVMSYHLVFPVDLWISDQALYVCSFLVLILIFIMVS